MTPLRKKILKIASVIFILLVILFVTITYSRYLHLKKTFVQKISHKATVLFGLSRGISSPLGDFHWI